MTVPDTAQKPKRRRVPFRVHADPGSAVFLAGSFNEWNPSGRKLRDTTGTGEYEGALLLPRGRHEYKYVINGEWVVDPENAEWTANEHGSLNSALTVQ